jgi:hypothetical protein
MDQLQRSINTFHRPYGHKEREQGEKNVSRCELVNGWFGSVGGLQVSGDHR